MSEQKQKKPFFKNLEDWSQSFWSRNSSSTEQQALSPGPSNNQLARSRSPFRRRPKNLTSSTSTHMEASPTIPTAVSTPHAPSGGGPGSRTAVSTILATAYPTSPAPSGGDPSTGAAAPTNSPSLWQRSLEIAQKKLLEKGLPPLKLNSHESPPSLECPAARKIVQLTIGDLQTAIHGQQNDKSATVQRLQEILKIFDKYARIVDTAIQHSPEVTALVWAGVRGLLQVALNHMEIIENLEQVTATIVEKVALCDFYGSVYAETSSKVILSSAATMQHLQQTLDSALPELYAAVLVFSVKARQYFDPSTRMMTKLGYMFKTFAIGFQPFIDDISEKEKRVRECADVATMKSIMEQSRKLQQIHTHLNDIESKLAPLTKLKEIMTKMERRTVNELLQMLTPLESPKRHQDVQSRRVDGTGTWLLKLDRYRRQWRDGATQDTSDRILCCYGAPGAGKTVISSIVIDDLISQFPQRDTVGIGYLYCDYRDQASQTVVNILGSLLQQFLIAISRVPDAVISLLGFIQQERKRVDIKDISKMLEITLPQFSHSFVCIDALDELEPHTQKGFLEALRREFSTARIFLTGRPHVRPAVNTYLGLDTQQQHSIDVIADPGDVKAYIDHAIAQDTNPDAMNEQLKADILSTIKEKSQGMFLLPVLHISMILGQQTIRKRREALKELPADLDKAFAGMIDRIKSRQSAEQGMQVLMWLHLAYRPLKLDELSHALAVVRGDVKMDKDNILSKKALLECCLGLVILDEETMTVRFVHYSVEEYFKQHASIYFPSRYSTAAETCLTYLNFNELAHPSTSIAVVERQMEDFPFLEYAACHWGHYAQHEQCNDSVRKLALKLLQHQSEKPHCALQVLHLKSLREKCNWICRFTNLFSGIHAAACFGLKKYVTALVNGHEDWNSRDDDGHTPLIWAAEEGHEAIVKLLIEREDVDVNSQNDYGWTPLSCAARNGHEAIVKLLIEHEDVDINSKNNYGRTPLSWAAEEGHETIVKLLIEHEDVDINSTDNYSWTPLSCAARNGHEAIVELLINRKDVDVNLKDNSGRTPLFWAARRGHDAIVKLLIECNDVDINLKDNDDQTPLSQAARSPAMESSCKRGHEKKKRKKKQAARNGHEAVVKLLSER